MRRRTYGLASFLFRGLVSVQVMGDLEALVVHLLKPVIALVISPFNEDCTLIDAGAAR